MQIFMRVSVIVPTYNEEKVIRECLESLSKQTYKEMEVIVVDDGSTDKTTDVISTIHYSLSTIHLLRQKHMGPGAARNLGAKHAKGDILVFVDADMTFEPDFVTKLTEPIRNGKAEGTFSKEEYVANKDNIWSQCWGINEGWEEGKRHPKNYPDTQRVFRTILKSEFEKVGGFSEDVGYTDDWTLSKKLGYEAIAVPGAKFYHKNAETLSEVFLQARWIGKRRYKLGKVGALIALIRVSLPISVVVGVVRAIIHRKLQIIPFKLVYDLGVFIGIWEYTFSGKGTK